jgi:hypothetical protein
MYQASDVEQLLRAIMGIRAWRATPEYARRGRQRRTTAERYTSRRPQNSPAILFSVQDFPLMKNLAIYREEKHPDGHPKVLS